MKAVGWFTLITFLAIRWGYAATPDVDRVILDPVSVENLGIETAPVFRSDFEEIIFALGRMRCIPAQRAIVSSRISGRIVEINFVEGERIGKGDIAVSIESRQPGLASPLVSLPAPLGGLVARSDIAVGMPVEPTEEIMEIWNLAEMYAVAQVPEDLVGKLPEDAKARIRLPAFPEVVFEGRFLRWGTQANSNNGTLEAVFLLANSDGKIRPEMRAEFSIVTGGQKQAPSVPHAALLRNSLGEEYLFVKDFELAHAYIRATVRVGRRNDTHTEILKGIFLGDEIVVRGAYPLAFAGEGTVSLKAALDAAHGHEHNEDGSEVTAEQRVLREAAAASGAAASPWTMFLAVLSGVLLLLLVLSRWIGPSASTGKAASDA